MRVASCISREGVRKSAGVAQKWDCIESSLTVSRDRVDGGRQRQHFEFRRRALEMVAVLQPPDGMMHTSNEDSAMGRVVGRQGCKDLRLR